MGSIVLLDLMGGVALLLWGLHMVLTGVLRAFGPHLRRFLGKALGNRFSAFGAGLGMTALLQSSTATGLMTTSLAADGLVSLVPALAIMLGATSGPHCSSRCCHLTFPRWRLRCSWSGWSHSVPELRVSRERSAASQLVSALRCSRCTFWWIHWRPLKRRHWSDRFWQPSLTIPFCAW